MPTTWLLTARLKKGWTQADAASRLGVSQGYWSLLETGRRAVPARLLPSLRRQLPVPATTAPLNERAVQAEDGSLARALAVLGYPGFAHLRAKRAAPVNPAVVLLVALRMPDLDARVVEALPWVVRTYTDLDWPWLVRRAKIDDLQNRLGFVVGLACDVASRAEDDIALDALRPVLQALDGSRLVKEDTLCRSSMPIAECRHLASARSDLARHWNVMSDLAHSTHRDQAVHGIVITQSRHRDHRGPRVDVVGA